jgi:hypothetical protein
VALALVGVALFALPAGGLARQPPASGRCAAPAHARVRARDSRLLAWTQVEKGSARTYGLAETLVYVCARQHGRPHEVYSWEHEGPMETQQIEDFGSAGPSFAFVFYGADQYGEYQLLMVVDAAGRTQLNQEVEHWPIGDADCSPCFGDYAIDASGDVAWTNTSGNYTGPGALTAVLFHAPGGRTQTLAAAASVTNVGIADGAVTWDANGVAASVPVSAAKTGATGTTGATTP